MKRVLGLFQQCCAKLGNGGPYGLHYVLGFSYLKNNNSEKWYHVADNWKAGK